MNSIKTVVKYEFMRYFLSPLAYVYLVSFLILSGSCAIYFGHFFSDGLANLWGLFDYQPWVYLLFIPGIAMRSWAEEFKSKSIIQILTVPISLTHLVWGKFLASWLFSILAIALTFPFWITVNILGNPDNTVILVSYLGCFLLAGAVLSISQTMSSLTKSPVISLVLAVFVNLLFFWSGFDYVLFWARELFSDVIVDTIISFSFLNHFSSLSRGLVELRDLIFFGSLIVFFNLITMMVISLRTKGSSGLISSSNLRHSFVVFTLLFLGFFGINIIANNVFREVCYDFTSEKYLTLTKSTKDVLKNLERPVVARLYYSPILERRNPEIRQMFDRIKLMLRHYKNSSNGKFDYKIYNPKFLDRDEDKAIADGLQPIPLININQNALFGLTMSDDLVNKSVIPFFAIERLPFLEQDLTTNLYKLHHKKKTLGLFSNLPIMGKSRVEDITMDKWEIMNVIGDFYDVKLIEKEEDLDVVYDVFMLVHPYGLSDSIVEKIKKQRKILLMLDVADEASKLYSPTGGNFTSSHLGKLGDYWGINFYDIGVVADFNNSITVDDTINYSTNPSFTQDLLQFKVQNEDFNPNHRITYKLNSILFSSASMIMPKNNADVSYYPLIKTSKNSSLMDVSYATKSKMPREILSDYIPENYTIVLAAEFLSNNPLKPFNIIAVADTDFAYDAFWTKENKFLDRSYNIPLFDSANFILNSLDYLTDNDDLIQLRGKNAKKRILDKIDTMRKNNIYKYKLKENDIFSAINGAKQSLKEIVYKRTFEERDTFTVDEIAVIGNIRNEINSLRQQLSNLKLNSHNDIEKIELKVKFFNIYFISLLIIFISLCFVLKNKQLNLCDIKDIFCLSRKMLKLLGTVSLILLLALLSVYYDHKNNVSEYENKPVFEDFDHIINNIYTVKLQSHQNTLTFNKINGIWVLKEHPEFSVYQERLRRLLVSIEQMTFYEKKSDKISDMKFFGFSYINDKNSNMINVSLLDNQNSVLKTFDIGYYDINLGRGSKAAYLRLDRQFQIWLVSADFYNLSLDYSNWVYNTVWNLRFGRFISYNNKNDNLKTMNLVKTLLNSSFIGIKNNVSAKKIETLKVHAENNNFVNLVFYKTKDNHYYLKYDYMSIPQGKHWSFFSENAKNVYFEISKDDWVKIKNAIDK